METIKFTTETSSPVVHLPIRAKSCQIQPYFGQVHYFFEFWEQLKLKQKMIDRYFAFEDTGYPLELAHFSPNWSHLAHFSPLFAAFNFKNDF